MKFYCGLRRKSSGNPQKLLDFWDAENRKVFERNRTKHIKKQNPIVIIMRIYFDTNIYMDFLENRKDNLRPLGEFAFQSIKRGIECEFYIVFSYHVADELRLVRISSEDVNNIINWVGIKMIKAKILKEDEVKAKEIAKKYNIHIKDALHYAIAEIDADKLLTNDNELKMLPMSIGYESV